MRPETPKAWTSVTAADTLELPETWARQTPPQQLQYVADNIRPPAKLLDILMWSLERGSGKEWPLNPTHDDAHASGPYSNIADTVFQSPATFSQPSESTSNPLPNNASIASPGLPCAVPSKTDLFSATLGKLSALKVKKTATPTSATVPKPVVSTEECTSCFDDVPTRNLVRLSCTHYYCKPCLGSLVMTAIQNESSYPPKCCLTEIPAATILIPLDQRQRDLYKNKAAEYSIPANKRSYCPNAACSKWIPPSKLRASPKCPSCNTKICSQCRGPKHTRASDCPQDQGLEAAISTAEAHGWRRCHRCRTMVERTAGCRHITCSCGAEFCYICGGKWGRCSCTEIDEAQRQATLERQRAAAATREREEDEEDEEMRRALHVIAAIEAREAVELDRRRREEGNELSQDELRRQEEEQLARLEEERVWEEERRRQEAEALERELREVLQISIRLEAQALEQSLLHVTHRQYTRLDDWQGAREMSHISAFELLLEEHNSKDSTLREKIAKTLARKLQAICTAYEKQKNAVLAKQEEQEDDLFLKIQLHLQGKPNKEVREQRMLTELRQQQALDRSKIDEDVERDSQAARSSAERETELLKRAMAEKIARLHSQHECNMANLASQVRIDRHWFCLVSQRRAKMVEEHNRLMSEESNRGVEPVGLTRSIAYTIQPLPDLPVPDFGNGPLALATRKSCKQSDTAAYSGNSSLQQAPVELESPSPPLVRNGGGSPPGSCSSYTTTSNYSFVSVKEHEGTSRTPRSMQSGHDSPEPLHDGKQPHPPEPLNSQATYIPRNGPAFIASKSGESSKPIDLRLQTNLPPTPPETPPQQFGTTPRRWALPHGTATEPSISALASTAAVLAAPATSAAPQAWSFYNTLPASGKGKGTEKGKGKGKEGQAMSQLDKGQEEQGPEETGSVKEKRKEGKRGSRWPFWRKEELTPEQIQRRLANLKIGDAL